MHFTFATDGRTFARKDHLLVIAPKACFGPRARGAAAIEKLLPAELADLAKTLGAEAAPGLLGGIATSRTTHGHRVTTGALADATSRHTTPARAESIRRVVAATTWKADGDNAVLLVLDDRDHVLPAVNAIARALPTFTRKTGAKAAGSLAILCALRSGSAVRVDAQTADVVRRAREAADLVDTPPTELDPDGLARRAKTVLRSLRGVTVREFTGPALLKQKLGGIHAVGRCARSAPRLLVATYAPSGARRHLALVGKGVTYDTGGLHLKARGNMETMKADMGGAAATLGAFAALVARRPRCRLSLLLCLAENAIGPAAYKPDDVLVMHSGKTVEINNTDAEGRLLLADGCSYAARVLGADTILDAATLTGAQAVATGDLHAAVVSNDADVERALLDAGRATGDLTWALPFAPEFYRAEFASPIADMRNSVKNRNNAQASCAAEFVHWHLDGTKARWGHVDLAAPAFRGDRGTGFGVALLVDAVLRLAKT